MYFISGVSFQDESFHNLNIIHDLKPKSDEITSMCWTSEDQAEFLTIQLDRKLKLFDAKSNSTSSLFSVSGGNGRIKGLHMTKNKVVVSAAESGCLSLWSDTGEKIKEIDAGDNLLVMVPDYNDENRCATGGNENPLKLWDLEKGEKTFTAKNVRPDNLWLRVPVCDNDIRFLSEHNIVTGTKNSELRLYDPRAQRRPVKSTKWLDEPITAVSLCNSPNKFFAGNTKGDMGLFDVRYKLVPVCKYKGFAGSIRDIVGHPQSPYVASCSIDRFVRLHDVNTKVLLKKVYCKVRLNRMLLKNDLSILSDKSIKEEHEESDDDLDEIDEVGEGSSSSHPDSSEDEALWNDMQKVRDTEKRRILNKSPEENDIQSLPKRPKIEELKRTHSPEEQENTVVKKRKCGKKLKRKWKEEIKKEVVTN
uniref:WD_REPEATS_REGION domain-containing protein n=1 Tax=Syphacia muris TaxID=451379 RepID=A0A0N5AEI3_9BILA